MGIRFEYLSYRRESFIKDHLDWKNRSPWFIGRPYFLLGETFYGGRYIDFIFNTTAPFFIKEVLYEEKS